MFQAVGKGAVVGIGLWLVMMLAVKIPASPAYGALPDICPTACMLVVGLAVFFASIPRIQDEEPEDDD